MTEELFKTGKDEQKLLRHIIRCYLRLLDFPTPTYEAPRSPVHSHSVQDHIAKEMPEVLKDQSHKLLMDDSVGKLHQELRNKLPKFGMA